MDQMNEVNPPGARDQMNPGSSRDFVRTTCVLPTLDNHTPLKRAKDLNDEEKANLKDVLYRAKQALMDSDCHSPNKQEMKKFINNVFNMWDSTRAHQLPDANSTRSSMKDKTIPIGRLDKDLPTEKELSEEAKRQGFTSKVVKSRAYKHMRDNLAVQTANIYRRANAQVNLGVSIQNGSQVQGQFCDEVGRFLPQLFQMTWYPGLDERRAYFEVFRAFDNFEATTINDYNLRVATFIARNRITAWGNGFPATFRPVDELFELLTPVRTIRDRAAGIASSAMTDAYQDHG